MSDAILLYGDLNFNDNVTYFLTKEGFKYPSPALKQQYADSALKDGQLPTEAWKFDNRVLTFSIFVHGTDAATLDAALRALYMQAYQDSTVTWCPAGRSTSFYFSAYRPEAVAVDSYFNTTHRNVNEAIVTWSGQACPFGHTARRSLETTILSGSIVKLAAGLQTAELFMDGTTAVLDAIHNVAFAMTGGVGGAWPGDSSNFEPMLGVSAPVIAQTTDNLLSNQDASLEGAGTGGHGTGGLWNCSIANSTAQAYHGTHSLAITSTAVGSTSRLPVTAVIGNVTGTFSARVKGPAGQSAYVQVGGNVSGDSDAVFITLTGGWDNVKSTHTWAGDSVRSVQLVAWETGIIYWDAMQLETGSVQTPFALDSRSASNIVLGSNVLSSNDSSFEATVGSWAYPTGCTAAVSTDNAYLGSKSLKMVCNQASPDYCLVDAVDWHSLGYLVPSTQYTFSARFKGVAGKGYRLYLFANTSGTTTSATITADGTWQAVSLTKTTGAGAITSSDARLEAVGASLNDVVYWDDIQLQTVQVESGSPCTMSIPTATIGLVPGGDASFVFCVNGPWAGNDGIAHYLLDMKGAGAGDVFSIYKHTDNKLYFKVGDKSAVTAALTATTWAANVNHIVIGTVTGGTINVYLAGTAGTPATGATREATLNANLYVGTKIDGTLPANAGVLVAGWDRVLTSEEIEGFVL